MPKLIPLAAFAGVALLASFVQGEVVKKTVDYKLPDGTAAKGVAVYDDSSSDKKPGVLVIPEWWGLTEYPQMRAEQLAEMGYVAFVADMYGEGKTTEKAEQAQEWAGKAGKAGLAKLAKPAFDQLKMMDQVDGSNLAAIGFCFGGSTVVAMAGSDYGDQLKAVASFHGGLGAAAAPKGKDYKGPPMLILHGGSDPLVKPADFAQFVEKSIEAGVPITVSSFPGALHAFSNPDATMMADKAGMKGMIAYDETAAKLSWSIMGGFFNTTLGSSPVDQPEVGGAKAKQMLKGEVEKLQDKGKAATRPSGGM